MIIYINRYLYFMSFKRKKLIFLNNYIVHHFNNKYLTIIFNQICKLKFYLNIYLGIINI